MLNAVNRLAHAAPFFAFHNEQGMIAFMLDPRGRCRCFDASPCDLVPDGGYTLWSTSDACTPDTLPRPILAASMSAVSINDREMHYDATRDTDLQM